MAIDFESLLMGGATQGQLADSMKISQPAVVKRLRRLEAAGKIRVEGKYPKVYFLKDDGKRAIDGSLDKVILHPRERPLDKHNLKITIRVISWGIKKVEKWAQERYWVVRELKNVKRWETDGAEGALRVYATKNFINVWLPPYNAPGVFESVEQRAQRVERVAAALMKKLPGLKLDLTTWQSYSHMEDHGNDLAEEARKDGQGARNDTYAIGEQSDPEIAAELASLRGVGPWQFMADDAKWKYDNNLNTRDIVERVEGVAEVVKGGAVDMAAMAQTLRHVLLRTDYLEERVLRPHDPSRLLAEAMRRAGMIQVRERK